MMRPDQNYIGFDPVAWVERLLEVNAGAQFPTGPKMVVHYALTELLNQIRGGVADTATVHIMYNECVGGLRSGERFVVGVYTCPRMAAAECRRRNEDLKSVKGGSATRYVLEPHRMETETCAQ